MYETHTTIVGNVATAVDRHRFPDGGVVARFRVANTERRYDKATGGWVDGDTLFVDVRCRRELAENVFASVGKGDRVVVMGRLFVREFEHEGQRRSAVTVDAQNVAADLSWSTVVVTRTRRRSAAPVPDGRDDDQRDPIEAADGPRSTSQVDGEPVPDDADLVGAVPGGEC